MISISRSENNFYKMKNCLVFALMLFGFPIVCIGQDAVLRAGFAEGPVQSVVSLSVEIDNSGSGIEGWAFSLLHDSGFAEIDGIDDGSFLAVVNNGGGPDFNEISIFADGFTTNVLVDFSGVATLPVGTGFEVHVVDYFLTANNGETSSPVSFCGCQGTASDCLGSPPVVSQVVAGVSFCPIRENGVIAIQKCVAPPLPPLNFECQPNFLNGQACQAYLSWEAPLSLVDEFEVLVGGVVLQTLPFYVNSTIVELSGFSNNEICIRSVCDGVESSTVCCSEYLLDCNGNTIPDPCDLVGGYFDCNNNGVLDICEISNGLVEDCNSNNLIDQCELYNPVPIDTGGGATFELFFDTSDVVGSGAVSEVKCLLGNLAGSLIGWTLKVCEDYQNDFYDIQSASPGEILGYINNGNPVDFHDLQICYGEGVYQDVYISFSGLASLPPSEEHEILNLELFNLGPNGAYSSIQYCESTLSCQTYSDFGFSDPYGGYFIPNQTQGVIQILDDLQFDCNSNSILDVCEISSGAVSDVNGDGVPDDCQGPLFRRGDPNADGGMDIGDSITVLGYLFGSTSIDCFDAGDSNDDGNLNIADAITILSALFTGGDSPPEPGPASCDLDPTTDSLGCESYGNCS